MNPLIQFRPYQDEAFRHPAGLLAWLYRRQSGKTHGLASTGIDWMAEEICTVIFASAALRLGQENILKEAAIWREVMGKLKEAVVLGQVTTNAWDNGTLLDVDAIADLFEHQKLETKLWHSNTNFSRSIVVAPNPDTAVGWTGHVILDEVGRMPEFRDLLEAMEPIVSSNSRYRVRMATTPPPNDDHYSYELLAPKPEDEAAFQVNPRGNWYVSQAGVLVHRVDAWDGAAAGVPLYDLQTREALTPEESRARAIDKTAWDRNYGIKFIAGGSAAVSRTALLNAQSAGMNEGRGLFITETLVAAA